MRCCLLLCVVLVTVGCDKGREAIRDGPVSDLAAARCALAVSEISQTLQRGDPAFETLPAYAKGCAGIYKRTACREAWMQEGTKPAADATITSAPRVVAIARACSSAYCPSLGEPKPKLCASGGADQADQDVFSQWQELHAAILDRDLKKHPALASGLKKLFGSTMLPVELPPAG